MADSKDLNEAMHAAGIRLMAFEEMYILDSLKNIDLRIKKEMEKKEIREPYEFN